MPFEVGLLKKWFAREVSGTCQPKHWEAWALPLGDTRMMTDYSANTSSTQTENVSRETSMDASRSEYTTAPEQKRGGRGTSKDLDEPELLLRGADTADGGAAVGAFSLRDGLAVLRRALDGVLHDLLGLALHAIRFNSHGFQTPFCSLLNRAQRPRENARDSRNLTSNTRPPLYGTAMQAHRGCRRAFIYSSTTP